MMVIKTKVVNIRREPYVLVSLGFKNSDMIMLEAFNLEELEELIVNLCGSTTILEEALNEAKNLEEKE